MENLKYIAFWSGWLPHRSQNMVLALGPEARGCRALQAWRRTRQPRVGNGEAWGGTRAPPPHGDGASATTFFFFLVQVLPEAGGGEEGERNKKKKLYWILVELGRDPGLPLSLVVKRSSYLRVLCCWLLIAHIRRGSNGLAPSQQYFMSFGGWQLLKHLGWRQEGTCFRRTDLRCSFIHLFSVFWRSRENSRGRLSFPGGWNQQSFGIWVGRGWEVSL